MPAAFDHLVVGGGIVGLSLARELLRRFPKQRILVLEKEPRLAGHASGRNSGVLHSGLYYPEGSLKARLCGEGARELAEYCRERGLPCARPGKVLVPVRPEQDAALDLLFARAKANGVTVEMLDEKGLAEAEPNARSATGRALRTPDTGSVDPAAVVQSLAAQLRSCGVELRLACRAYGFDPARAQALAGGDMVSYGRLYNAAGVHADTVAHAFGVGLQYVMLPFLGRYARLADEPASQVRGHVYPVPELGLPFLGVHLTKTVDGRVLIGPTATPALGREHYGGLAGLSPGEAVSILWRLARHYASGKEGFRGHVHAELRRLLPGALAADAAAFMPSIKPEHVLPDPARGIRAQLYDTEKEALVMDFLVLPGERSLHVLNAVSPAFTSAFPAARHVLDQAGIR